MSKKDNNFKGILKKYFKKEELFLLPNILCYLRVLLVIGFMVFYLLPADKFVIFDNNKANIYVATAFMVTSAYTDFLDGFIARKFNLTSNLGKAIDPIADKVSQFFIALSLAIRYFWYGVYESVWLLLFVFFAKEMWLMVADIILARHNKSYAGARWYGKVATFITYISLGTILLAGPYVIDAFPPDTKDGFFYSHVIIDSVSTLATFFLLMAAIGYTIEFFKILYKSKEEIAPEEKEDNKDA